MTGWLYLIRNRDLYKIGITKNFESRMRQLKPDDVVAKLYSRDFMNLERELHQRYKKFRIPQTEYFRLNKSHLKEIKQRIYYLNYPIFTNLTIFLKSFLVLFFIFSLIYVFIFLTINDLNIVLFRSIFWTEKVLYFISAFSIFRQSGKNLSFYNELKYRITRTIFFITFAIFIRYLSAVFY